MSNCNQFQTLVPSDWSSSCVNSCSPLAERRADTMNLNMNEGRGMHSSGGQHSKTVHYLHASTLDHEGDFLSGFEY